GIRDKLVTGVRRVLFRSKLDMVRVVKTFPARGKANPVVAVGPVDLHVEAGELVCIVGTSGCGKSTLLNIAGGLDTATLGDVTVRSEERRVGKGWRAAGGP